jgi:soluble lytic murein transglycosylase-like protein
METHKSAVAAIRLANVAHRYRLGRGLLALAGAGALLALGVLLPREPLLRQASAPGSVWDDPQAQVAAGTIVPEAGSEARREEQRTLTEFIARRYRVAQGAVAGFVSAAYRSGGEFKVDPLLILAVMAIESRYNPVAESPLGAKGLMQVIPRFHAEKLAEHGGDAALLDPQINIQVGAQILREYVRRFGGTEAALRMYAGALEEVGAQYVEKVLAERARLQQTVARAKPRG